MPDRTHEPREYSHINQGHYVETFGNRHLNDTVEIWCAERDESMVTFYSCYFDHCPMCGDELDEVPQA